MNRRSLNAAVNEEEKSVLRLYMVRHQEEAVRALKVLPENRFSDSHLDVLSPSAARLTGNYFNRRFSFFIANILRLLPEKRRNKFRFNSRRKELRWNRNDRKLVEFSHLQFSGVA